MILSKYYNHYFSQDLEVAPQDQSFMNVYQMIFKDSVDYKECIVPQSDSVQAGFECTVNQGWLVLSGSNSIWNYEAQASMECAPFTHYQGAVMIF